MLGSKFCHFSVIFSKARFTEYHNTGNKRSEFRYYVNKNWSGILVSVIMYRYYVYVPYKGVGRSEGRWFEFCSWHGISHSKKFLLKTKQQKKNPVHTISSAWSFSTIQIQKFARFGTILKFKLTYISRRGRLCAMDTKDKIHS